MKIDQARVHELLYQTLETELGGIQVYETAIQCASNEDLKEEWTDYLDDTQQHHRVLLAVFEELGLDPAKETPGRLICRHIGESLVQSMNMALESGEPPEAIELVACEAVVLAENKDHLNWELIGKLGEKMKGDEGKALRNAYDEVEDQEDEHLYHTKGWTRELWIKSLGMPAVLPPPEEVKKVETAIGAARAEQGRDKMLKSPAKRSS